MILIQYRFFTENGFEEKFDIKLDEESLIMEVNHVDDLPAWTELESNKCGNCPLKSSQFPHCPLAERLLPVVLPFERLVSFDEMNVEIITNNRCVSQKTNVQQSLSSLMGLIMATSGCPHTAFFRTMARFHLPLATLDESMFRAISSYLLSQYFLKQDGLDIDFELEGLNKIYENMHEVNSSIGKRIAAASKTDSSLNGLVKLDMYTKAMSFMVEESLGEIRYLFEPFLRQLKKKR